MSFFEVSAKSGVNVPVVFKNLTTQLQGLGDVNQSTMNNQTNVGMTKFLLKRLFFYFIFFLKVVAEAEKAAPPHLLPTVISIERNIE